MNQKKEVLDLFKALQEGCESYKACDKVEKPAPRKTWGQLWEPCPRCGREPVYMSHDHMCERCG